MIWKYQQGLSLDRWFRHSLAMQLANISADIGRAITWRINNEMTDYEAAIGRALELLNATLHD